MSEINTDRSKRTMTVRQHRHGPDHPTCRGGRHGYAILYHNPRALVNPTLRPGAGARELVMTGDREEKGIEADDPGEDRAEDPDVEIHAAILARERAGGSFPDT